MIEFLNMYVCMQLYVGGYIHIMYLCIRIMYICPNVCTHTTVCTYVRMYMYVHI